MAISLLQTVTGQKTAGTGTTFTVTMGNTATGSAVIIAVSNDQSSVNNTTNVTATGMTFTKIDDGINGGVAACNTSLWYAPNITGGATPVITVTLTAGLLAGAIAREYSGLSSSPLDAHVIGKDVSSNNTPTSGASATLTGSNDLVIGYGGTLDGGNTYTAGGGYGNAVTLKYATSTGDLGMEDKILSGSTAAQTATFTITNISDWACGVATFQAAGASGGMSMPTFNAGQTWIRHFAKNERQIISWPNVQGTPDIPTQMKMAEVQPGQTWVRQFNRIIRSFPVPINTQGSADIPQQMQNLGFNPGQTWKRNFISRQIWLPLVQGGIAWLQNLADSITSSDSTAKTTVLNKSDSVTSIDSISNRPTLNKNDSVTSSDSISNRPTLNKSDTVTTSDSLVKAVTKALSDSVTTSDSISNKPTKNLNDSVTSSDSITTKAVVKNLTDAVVVTESLLLTDGNLSDVVNGFSAYTFHINDTAASSDIASTTTTYHRSLTDSVTSSESISNQPIKNLSDSVTATDSLVKSLVKSLVDSVTSNDVVRKSVVLNKADSVSLSDVLSKTFIKRLTDSVVSSDLSLRYLNGVLVTGTSSSLTNSVILTDGTIVLRIAGQERQFIRLVDGRWALRLGNNLYMPL